METLSLLHILGVCETMKKLLVIFGICLVLAVMPMTIASPQLGAQHSNQLLTTTSPHLGVQHSNHLLRHQNPSLMNDTFTGIFAMKNESGYVPLGTLSGTFSDYGFEGIWALDNGTASGTFSGEMWGYLCWGELQTDGSNESQWFAGLFRVNATDNSFQAVSIVFGYNGYAIRYAIGDIE
jgi:hypothetical protein